MPIFPKGHDAYKRAVEWGTLIKLYAYQLRNTGNIIRGDGLLYKLDLLLPDPALPIRMHECRPARRGAGAAEQTTNMNGLFARLSGNENLEHAPPGETPITVRGVPSTWIVRPRMPLSPAKRVRHVRSLRIATLSRPGMSSSGAKVRPIAGAMPSAWK